MKGRREQETKGKGGEEEQETRGTRAEEEKQENERGNKNKRKGGDNWMSR
jgi:hypothetical protein